MTYTEKELEFVNKLKSIGLFLVDEYQTLSYKDIVKVKCIHNHMDEGVLNVISRRSGCTRCKILKNYHLITDKLKDYGYTINQDESEWIASDSRVEYICNMNHHGSMNIRELRKGRRCGRYYTLKTFYKVKDKLERKGFKYISNESDYINDNSIIKYICPKGHLNETLLEHLSRGKGCRKCGHKSSAEKLKIPIKEILKNFIDEDYVVVDGLNEYQGVHSYLQIKCPSGHIYSTSVANFNQGSRCFKCNVSIKRRAPIEEVLKMFDDNGYRLVDRNFNYENSYSYADVICPNGHVYSTTISNFKTGYRCNTCANESLSGENNSQWKGGITPLQNHIRTYILPWKIDSFNSANHTCFITGSTKKKKLVVHHHKNFSDILSETLSDLNYTIKSIVNEYSKEEMSNIEKLCLQKHYDYGLGIAMNEDVHILFHKVYGKRNNTMEQVLEFKEDYLNGNYPEVNNI